ASVRRRDIGLTGSLIRRCIGRGPGCESGCMTAFTVLIDGACPLCAREAALLRRLDRGREAIRFVDISDPAFDASVYGRTQSEVMGSIHGVTSSGEIVEGMEVFRRAYAGVGLGWLLAPTRWPIFRGISDRLYAWFARHRLQLTGRCHSGTCQV
ncbi:MAG: thiol-disulfide oxidoreductase DCC family protein, partial [Phycisphaerales bacterium]